MEKIYDKINNVYREENTIEQMGTFFENEGFLQLTNFFEKEFITLLNEKINKIKFSQKIDPMAYSYGLFNKENNFDLIEIFEFFKSKKFIEYLEKITGFELQIDKVNLKEYKHYDFTILNDNLKEKEDKIDVIFDLTNNWNEKYGGVLTYLTKLEEVFYLEPDFNSLTILFRPKQIMKYLKYINNLSKDKKIIRFEIEYKIVENYIE